MRNFGIYKGALPTSRIERSGNVYQLFYDYKHEKIDSEEIEDNQTHYSCELIEVKKLDYATIISAIIRDKYTQDDVEAILSNYQLCKDNAAGDKSAEYTERYNAYQSHRTYAKQIANELL